MIVHGSCLIFDVSRIKILLLFYLLLFLVVISVVALSNVWRRGDWWGSSIRSCRMTNPAAVGGSGNKRRRVYLRSYVRSGSEDGGH